MHIINLNQEPEHITQLAQWHHSEWAHLNPSVSLQERIQELQSHLGPAAIPTTFIGKINNAVVGTAALIKSDMHPHPELTPWLASVYVDKAYRNNQYGTELVKHAMQYAQQAHLDALYLFTPSAKDFYKTLGWETLLVEQYQGETVTIMKANVKNLA